MPSGTFLLENLEKDGPVLDVLFLISSELEKKYIKEKKPIPAAVAVKTLIDTGASACVIKKGIPENLGLNPIGTIKITTPSHQNVDCYKYFMRMVIPSHGLTYEGPFIATAMDGQDIGSLIGRDVLKSGILIYIGYSNQFTLSLL